MKSICEQFLCFCFFNFSILFITVSCIHYTNKHKDHHSYSFSNQKGEVGKSSFNQVVRDLSFFPINGLRFRLSELKDIKAIVFVMREKDCPISEKYGVRLTEIEKEYSNQGVKFIYVYVGQVKVQESAKADLEKFGFKGAYVLDLKQRLVDTLKAKTTGDVFVLTLERKVIYKGPVDDQYHILQQAPSAKNHYLSNVLKAVLSGEKITPKELPAPGCFISRPHIKEEVFYKDVAPIISRRCTICHNPKGTGPMNFVNYQDIVGRRKMFQFVLENDLMPPWYIDTNTGPWVDDLSLEPQEKAMLLKWIYGGYLKKKTNNEVLWKKEKSSKASFDYVINLPERVEIPADKRPEMFSDYKTFVIPTHFKEDKWIKDIKVVLKPKGYPSPAFFCYEALPHFRTALKNHSEL